MKLENGFYWAVYFGSVVVVEVEGDTAYFCGVDAEYDVDCVEFLPNPKPIEKPDQ